MAFGQLGSGKTMADGWKFDTIRLPAAEAKSNNTAVGGCGQVRIVVINKETIAKHFISINLIFRFLFFP